MKKYGFAIGALCLFAASGWAQNVISARPGLINYTEGDVMVDGQPVPVKSNGKKLLDRGQVLDTTTGKAELLLTPGVFLRVGDHSAIKMVSPDLDETKVELQRGEAMVEVADLFKGNHVEILNQGSSTELLKKGLYRFDANQPAVYVYDGKAQVRDDDKKVDLGKGKEALLSAALKEEKFDRKKDKGPLYDWSEVRSEYLSEANVASARTVVVNNGFWGGPGWYWNPWFSAYSFIPGNGIMYSPFGFGFYSPGWVGYAPVYAYRGFPGGGGVIPGRPLPRPRIIRPAMPAPGVSGPRGGVVSARAAAVAPRGAAPVRMGGGTGGGAARMGGGMSGGSARMGGGSVSRSGGGAHR